MTTRAARRKQQPEQAPTLTADAWLDAQVAETTRAITAKQQQLVTVQRELHQLQGALAAYQHSQSVMKTPEESAG